MSDCIGRDPTCPCHDGDLCHYKDAPDGSTKGWPVPRARSKVADRETTITDFELENEWRTLGFSCRDAWLTWRLAAVEIPAVIENGQAKARSGTLTIGRLAERPATRYSWTP